MLAEGFLRVLRYREERKFASASTRQKLQTHPQCVDPFSFDSDSPEPATDSSQEGSNQEEPASSQFQELMVVPHGSAGLSIPGCLPAFTLDPDLTALLDNCSLLEQYPDLQVADSGLISHNPPRAFTAQPALVCELSQQQQQQPPHSEPVTSIPDQGYLAMTSVNSLDLPGSGLEPMSNSVLNGLLDKQLEEVYMQHLTDNLARCNSHLGNSLLHGLVPPPQPSSQGPDSLEPSLGGPRNDSQKTINYLSTQNMVPCSSNFSSPVLRISEADGLHLQ
ncbi:uncharacterized protein V6R79_018514 [Siganus canaliculatus]